MAAVSDVAGFLADLEEIRPFDYNSMIERVNQENKVRPKYQYQELIPPKEIISEFENHSFESDEDLSLACAVAEIRLLWNQNENYRTLEMLKELSYLETHPAWHYFQDKEFVSNDSIFGNPLFQKRFGPKLKDVIPVLVEWWQEISTTSKTNDWTQNQYIAFSRWIKKYIKEEDLFQGFDFFYRHHSVDGSLLIAKFPDYYWNHYMSSFGEWCPSELNEEDLNDLVHSLSKNKTPAKVKDWIYGASVGNMAEEYLESHSHHPPTKRFIKNILSYRLGGIEITHDFIRKLARMEGLESENENKQFTMEFLGLFIEQDDLRTHFNNPLALDIGTPFLGLSDVKNDSVRKQKIRTASVRNIGMYSFKEGGIAVNPQSPLENRLEQIRKQLKKSDILIGFNLWDFDLEVLKGKGLDIQKEFPDLVIYDIMRAIYGKHSSVRTKLSDLLVENGLPEKDSGPDRDVAAMNDSWAALGCFFLLTTPSLGLKWKDTKLRTDIFEGINQLREIKDIISERNSYEVKIQAWIEEHLK